VTVGNADSEDGVDVVATGAVVTDADRVLVGGCGLAMFDPLLQAETSTSATATITGRRFGRGMRIPEVCTRRVAVDPRAVEPRARTPPTRLYHDDVKSTELSDRG
jgi:hypothetical protein